MKKKITVVGLNHRTAPVEVREKVAFEQSALSKSLKRLISLPSVEEGVILSTCNRVEVLTVSPEEKSVLQDIKGFLAEQESVEGPAGFALARRTSETRRRPAQ